METRTQLIIALTSILTSAFTVFLSNFLAPRINAWYERKYKDGLVLKKTLWILLEIEVYVQRNLKHPSMAYVSESLLPVLKEQGHISEKQATALSVELPEFLRLIQPQLVQILPDKSEELHQEFTSILKELSTVDPLLAYKISERHTISPIQRMKTYWIDVLKNFGVPINEEDEDVQLLNRFAESLKGQWIDELLNDIRTDIVNVAAKAGKKYLKEVELHFIELEVKRKEGAKKITEQFAKIIPEKKDSKGVPEAKPIVPPTAQV